MEVVTNMKKLEVLLFALFLSLLLAATVLAAEANGISAQVPSGHWSCREIAALAKKYGAAQKLPASGYVERRALAGVLLDILERVQEKCEVDGNGAVPREDMDRLAALYGALRDELSRYEGYQTRREAIEQMLAKPETPPFVYKIGVNGFLRGEGVGNFRLTDFSFQPDHGEGRFLYRVKPYAYWHPTGWLDIHAEGQGYGFAGGSQRYNKVSLYQGFVEVREPGRERVALKGGRQELSYGSTFIVGPNSFYDGLVFDAVRLRVVPVTPLTVDLLLGAYAPPFNAGLRGNLAGVYATWTFSEGSAAEAYAFRDTGSADHHTGEYLAIWGGRGTATLGPVSLEFEPVYESGRTFNSARGSNDRIDAFGGHLDATYATVLAGYNNKLFASYAYASGSAEAADGVSSAREFRNPANNTSLIGDLHVFGDLSGVTVAGHHASGLQIYTLGWGADLSSDLNFSATGRYFLANGVESGFSKHLGLETDFTLTYAVNDNLSVIAGYDRFFTGGFFRDASGRGGDIDYGYLMLQFDLSKSRPKGKKA